MLYIFCQILHKKYFFFIFLASKKAIHKKPVFWQFYRFKVEEKTPNQKNWPIYVIPNNMYFISML